MLYSVVKSINLETALLILSAFADAELVNSIGRDLFNRSGSAELFEIRRFILSNVFGVTGKTPVYADAWAKMLSVRKALFNPADLGAYGKYAEVRDRLELYKMNGQSKTTWAEFSAHKHGKKDISDKIEGIHIEKKTGVGDWLYSKRAKTLESVRKEYERKVNDKIRWDYEKTIVKPAGKRTPEKVIELSIHWEKPWTEYFEILEGFNGSLDTWFKPVKYTENGFCFQMQEISTSEKKIAYLMQYNDR